MLLTAFSANAAMYLVGNSPLGNGWDPSSGVEMTDNSDGTYTFTFTATSNTTLWFVFADGLSSSSSDWDTFNGTYRYGPTTGSNQVLEVNTPTTTQKQGNGNGSYQFKFTSGTEYTIKFDLTNLQITIITSSTEEEVTDHVYSIAGNNASIFGAEWDQTATATEMTKGDDGVYTWTSAEVELAASTAIAFKVVEDHDWGVAYPSSNYTLTATTAGTYTLTITFDYSTKTVNATLTLVSSGEDDPTETTYYITGDTGLGLAGWNYAPTDKLTLDESTGYYTYTYDVTTAGDYYFVFANGQGSDWNSFNATYRIGPTGGNQTVTLDSWTTTQLAGGDNGSYEVSLAAGTVTITFNPEEMQFKVEGTAPAEDEKETITVYVKADAAPTLYAWNDNGNLNGDWPGTAMTGYAGCSDVYYAEIEASSMNIIFNNGNGSQTGNITGLTSEVGTYYYTYNGTTSYTVADVESADELCAYTAETETITVYVKADAAPYLYAWNEGGSALNGAWPGTQMTGYAGCDDVYYAEIEASAMSIILNDGAESNIQQTADIKGLTSEVGTYYYTYDGASTYAVADVADAEELCNYSETSDVYILGNTTSWVPNEGMQMTYNEETDLYTYTFTTADSGDGYSYFSFTKKLSESADDWDGIASYRFGPVSEGDFVMTKELLSTHISKADDGNYPAIKIPAGMEITVTVSLTENYIQIDGTWPEATYTLAGNLTSFFGTSWDATDSEGNNTMEYDSENNRYVWHGTGFISNEQLASSTDDNGIRCKVVKNHVNWIGNDNYIINVDNGLYTGGEYDLYVYYNPETGEVTHEIKQLSIEVNVSALEYGTMYYEKYALQVPEGVKSVFNGSVNNGTFEPLQTWNVGGIIPAGTAVVINALEGTYYFPIGDTSDEAKAGSMLFGFDEEQTTTYDGIEDVYFYKLSWKDGTDQKPENAAFLFESGTAGGAFTIPAHKAFLVAPQSSGVRAIALPDVTTGIEKVAAEIVNGKAYDLQGRRISKLQKGVNIVNGVKVLVK